MKTKNVFLATVAFMFAIGTAFASFFSASPVFIKAIVNQGEEWQCYDTGVSCDATGSNICAVNVTLKSGTVVTVASNAAAPAPLAYKSGCVNVQQSINDVSLTSPLSGSARPFAIVR